MNNMQKKDKNYTRKKSLENLIKTNNKSKSLSKKLWETIEV